LTLAIFAVAAPGLEEVVADEARALGAADARAIPGGAVASGDAALLVRLNLGLRAASRVLVRVAEARVRDLARLRRFAAEQPWERFAAGAPAPAVSASARRSRLYHTGAIAERVAGGIADRLGAGTTPLGVHVRVEDDVVTLSVDSSGELLHRRGYRTDIGEAPLRETLAAGVLALAGWRPDEPLHDPTCGSGTFVLEAALRATGRLPGARRAFACERWPSIDPALVARLRAAERPHPAPAPLGGGDVDPAAIAAARANALRAGVAGDVRFEIVEAARAVLPAGPPGLVVCNPPYGRRISARNLADIYRAVGALARRAGWRLAVLAPDDGLARAAGLGMRGARLSNGGVSVGLFLSGDWRG
jgi:putative N6-adenine-specific DNA methylase